MRQCGNCGARIEGKTRFCPECGTAFVVSKWDISKWDLGDMRIEMPYIILGLSDKEKRLLQAVAVALFLGVLLIIAQNMV